jgi:uncharacterized protein YecE (DUF72 family)
MEGEVRIGTSGWHYPRREGGWNGLFYPKPRPRDFDELSYYAEFFDTVEINTTFYGQPTAGTSAQWVRRTPPGFEFAVKLYQQFTHPRMFRARVEQSLARTLGSTDLPQSAIDALTAANQADFDAFRKGIEPLALAGKLGALLAQFPASFRNIQENRVHLAALLRAFHGYAVAVELRHRTWSDQSDETLKLLDAFGGVWAWIDEPKFRDSVKQPDIARTPFAYVRLHGRNAAAWWHHADRDARYDYLYSVEEIQAFADRLVEARTTAKARVYFNNHPNAKAAVNAAQLKALLGQNMRALPPPLQPQPAVINRSARMLTRT